MLNPPFRWLDGIVVLALLIGGPGAVFGVYGPAVLTSIAHLAPVVLAILRRPRADPRVAAPRRP